MDLQGRRSRRYLWGYCVSRASDPVAGRLAFPAHPLDLRAVAGQGLQGFPVTSAVSDRSLGQTTFVAFTSSSERSCQRWNRLSLVPPLMGFECRPPTDTPSVRPLPGAEAPIGPASPDAGSRSALVVSHHHNGLLRTGVTGLLHPATGQGFAAFHRRRPAPPEGGSVGADPRDAFHTLRRVPLVSSRTTSLWPLPSCRYRPVQRGRPAEAGLRAERRPPKRETYTRCPARGFP